VILVYGLFNSSNCDDTEVIPPLLAFSRACDISYLYRVARSLCCASGELLVHKYMPIRMCRRLCVAGWQFILVERHLL